MAKKKQGTYRYYFTESVRDASYQEKFKPELVLTKEVLIQIREEAIKSKKNKVAVDTETTGLTFMKDEIVGISFSFDAYSGYYIPLRHKRGNNIECDDPKEIIQFFFDNFIASPDFIALFYNVIFDLFMFIKEGCNYKLARFFEVMSLTFNADPDAPEKGLKFSASHYLGRDLIDFETTVGGKVTFDTLDPKSGYTYAVADSAATYGLYQKLMPLLSKECPISLKLDNNVVKAFLFYLQQDVYIDKDKMVLLYNRLDEERKGYEDEIFQYFGRHFNLDCLSPDTLITVYENKQIPFKDLTKNDKVLTPLGYINPVSIKEVKQTKRVTITLNNTKLQASPNHLFFVKQDNQIKIKKAIDLKVNDILFDQEDEIDLANFLLSLKTVS